MNERIKQLKQQARDFYLLQEDLDCSTSQLHTLVEEKFAELIVQDCIDILSPYTVNMNRIGEEYLHPIQEIKKHFGVKL